MPIVTGRNTQVILGEDGWLFVTTREYELKPGERKLEGFKQLDVCMRMDEIVIAENAQLFIAPEIVDFVIRKNDYQLFAELPEYKWEPKRISKIVFEDGVIWEDPFSEWHATYRRSDGEGSNVSVPPPPAGPPNLAIGRKHWLLRWVGGKSK